MTAVVIFMFLEREMESVKMQKRQNYLKNGRHLDDRKPWVFLA